MESKLSINPSISLRTATTQERFAIRESQAKMLLQYMDKARQRIGRDLDDDEVEAFLRRLNTVEPAVSG